VQMNEPTFKRELTFQHNDKFEVITLEIGDFEIAEDGGHYCSVFLPIFISQKRRIYGMDKLDAFLRAVNLVRAVTTKTLANDSWTGSQLYWLKGGDFGGL